MTNAHTNNCTTWDRQSFIIIVGIKAFETFAQENILLYYSSLCYRQAYNCSF